MELEFETLWRFEVMQQHTGNHYIWLYQYQQLEYEAGTYRDWLDLMGYYKAWLVSQGLYNWWLGFHQPYPIWLTMNGLYPPWPSSAHFSIPPPAIRAPASIKPTQSYRSTVTDYYPQPDHSQPTDPQWKTNFEGDIRKEMMDTTTGESMYKSIQREDRGY